MRPIGPRVVNTVTTDLPIILDLYNKSPMQAQVVVDEAALGTLAYVAEYTMTDPFATGAAAAQYQTLGAGTLVGTIRTFLSPANVVVTAVRIRSTAGAGSISYYVTQGGSGN